MRHIFKVGDIVMVKFKLSSKSPVGIIVDAHTTDYTTTVNGKFIQEYTVYFASPQQNWRTGDYFGDEIIHIANINKILT